MLSPIENIKSHLRCAGCLFELLPQICSIPEDIPIEATFKPNFPRDDEHQVDLALLDRTSQRGCSTCYSIRSVVVDYYGSRDVEDITWMRGGFYVGPMMESWDIFTLADDDDYISYRNISSSSRSLTAHPYLGKYSFPSGDTISETALKRFRSWLSKCSEEHSHCGGCEPMPMPHRVIEIQDCRKPCVRLVDSRDMTGEYACLSHRWCPATVESSLVRKNLSLYRDMVPCHALYPVLKDAIFVAGLAGLRYIWIDCLCILQDDAEDWNIEAATMASVYENASLTIAASGCDSMQGLFYKSSLDSATQINTAGKESVYIRPLLKHPVWRQTGDATEFSFDHDYPLMSRGWVFQERTLSKRMIHFTKQELVWECIQNIWCECKSTYAPWSGDSAVAIDFSGLLRKRNLVESPWDKIVATFTKMDLTFAGDRLPALSGIARRFGEYHGYNYLAGLWEQTIEWDFFWGRGISDVAPRPRPRLAPTWSWTSITGHTIILSHMQSRSVPGLKPCEFLTFHYHDIKGAVGADAYGKLDKALLHVSGPVVHGSLTYPSSWRSATDRKVFGRCEFSVNKTKFNFQTDYDFTIEGPDYLSSGQAIACLLTHGEPVNYGKDAKIGITKAQGIILRTLEGEELSYERIGYLGATYSGDAPTVSWLLEHSENMRIMLL
ncbi:heterokaryon incompatibility protein-domain-containing protein [Xylariaceae sp. FL1651]|nr:heterokaryon incompatibility protein-domain-containing protein [Xylariaceae sp. FL1651]